MLVKEKKKKKEANFSKDKAEDQMSYTCLNAQK